MIFCDFVTETFHPTSIGLNNIIYGKYLRNSNVTDLHDVAVLTLCMCTVLFKKKRKKKKWGERLEIKVYIA